MMTRPNKHLEGLKRLEEKLSNSLDDIKLEVQYPYSDVDLLGVDNDTLKVFEYKSKGNKKKAMKQLRTHKKHFIEDYINNNPQYNISKVEAYYANPKGEILFFEYRR